MYGGKNMMKKDSSNYLVYGIAFAADDGQRGDVEQHCERPAQQRLEPVY